jgi:hypothetical protein
MADMSAVERGEYPGKPNLTTRHKVIWGVMIAYSIIIYFQIASYYVWGGH